MIERSLHRLVGRRSTSPMRVVASAAMLVTLTAGTSDASECGGALEVRFIESAPRDRFEILHGVPDATSDAPIGVLVSVLIDLEGSAGDLVFDTEQGGIGVEVFQRLRVDDGKELLTGIEEPADGGQRVELRFNDFVPGERFVFSIDVDDRMVESELGQIRVAGAEIAGATVEAMFTDDGSPSVRRRLSFGSDARATSTC